MKKSQHVAVDFANRFSRNLSLQGALLIAVGLFTGLWAGAALTGVVTLVVPRLALSAHLNALLAGLLLLGVASTGAHLRFDGSQFRRLSWLALTPAWGNWAITLLASCLGVTGLTFNSDPRNNAVAALLQVFVVIPSFLFAGYWIRGFILKRRA